MTGTQTSSDAAGGTAAPAQIRLDELDKRLGDPWDGRNPLGFTAVLDADERAEMFADGERALDDYGLNAEFVPVEHGGRLTRVDHLVEIMRTVYRRDPCLGLGYGFSSFISSVNVWTAADPAQQRQVADILLRGGKIAAAYHELAHGNDMARTDFQALPSGAGRLLLNGRKEVVTNIQRSDAMVMFARTDARQGSRSHSQILVEKDRVADGRMSYLPRFASAGMRGVQLGGVEFCDCPVPENRVLGNLGQGLETMLKSFQITRTTLVGMFTGALDTGLRTTLRHVHDRRLYGRTAAELPQVRSTLAGVFLDLLISEVFATVSTRALHLVPAETGIYAQAVKYHVSKTLIDAMNRLSGVLGAHFYIRDPHSTNAIFQKMLRDIQPAGFGHIARSVCQMSLLQQLPLLARRSWLPGAPAPDDLFRLDADLPPMPFDQLAVSAGGRERLSSSLAAGLEALCDDDPEHREIRRLAEGFVTELAALAEECGRLPVTERTVDASSHTYDLTARYTNVLVAAACYETWRHNQHHPDPFWRDPAWLVAALHRLSAPAGAVRAPLPEHLEHHLFTELTERHEAGQSFGINKTGLSADR
ncbi:acyl-CoA dehydrogenase [Streptomyces sp. NPDC057654]|uniref:acyl-CoA dehydrogenase n=1 Tax=Streptomyces sp. NPDC057654 TaxID=3346196 RepID=UPI003691D97C